MKYRAHLFVALLILAAGFDSFAQNIPPVGSIFVNLDYARFRYDDQSNYLEVYYGFYPNSLTFLQRDGKYYAGMLLQTRIRSQASEALVVDRRLPIHLAEEDTSKPWYRFPVVTQAGFVLPFGLYNLEVIAIDSLAPGRSDTVRAALEMTPFSQTLDVSDVELCKKIAVSRNRNDLFYKNSLEVVPIPSLVFGIATSPVLYYYAELYNTTPGAAYTLKTTIINEKGEIVRELTKQQRYRSASGLLIGNTTITSFPAGKYLFRCLVLDENGREVTRAEKDFTIFNPHLMAQPQAKLSEVAAQLAALPEKALRQEFEYARYLATDEEVKLFAALDNEAAMREFLTRFWVAVGKGRYDKPPVERQSYLARIEQANAEFSAFGKKGWLTDRGRVLAIYGLPDEIERVPADAVNKAYRVWRYFSIESGVEFIFVDKTGYNDFELVHSTKRGELHDELWKRFLQ